jgi:hypothetical protein
MSNGSGAGSFDLAKVLARSSDQLAAIYKEIKDSNRIAINHENRKPIPRLADSTSILEVQVGSSPPTDLLGNPQIGSATANIINYPSEDWNACCKGDPPTAESVVLTLDYDVQENQPPPAGPGNFLDSIETAFATIAWGGSGNSMDVDLVRGMSIPLSGQRVIVKIGYPVDRSYAPGSITQPTIVVKASVGLDSVNSTPGNSGCVRRTIRYGSVGGAGTLSVLLPIPPHATCVAFQGMDVAIPTMEYRQYANGANPAGFLLSAATIGKGDDDTIPIANGARFAAFFNANANPVTIRAIYYLG